MQINAYVKIIVMLVANYYCCRRHPIQYCIFVLGKITKLFGILPETGRKPQPKQ